MRKRTAWVLFTANTVGVGVQTVQTMYGRLPIADPAMNSPLVVSRNVDLPDPEPVNLGLFVETRMVLSTTSSTRTSTS